MVIRSSSAREVQQLLTALRARDAVRRDAAIARLRVLGSRAVGRLEELAQTGTDDERGLALQALEGIDDPRVVDLALAALADRHIPVRLAAIQVLRPWVAHEDGTRVMEALVTRALDDQQSPELRAAARDALSQLPHHLIEPVLSAAAAAATDDPLPGDPAAVQAWLTRHGDAPLSALHALVTTLKSGETSETHPGARRAWQVARGAAHAVIAHRGSAVALYDLRETFEAATAPLPLDYLTAATAIGDAACLEAMAKAWSATSPSEVWWRERLADTAVTVMARLKLTRRHAVIKRTHTRWPGFLK